MPPDLKPVCRVPFVCPSWAFKGDGIKKPAMKAGEISRKKGVNYP